MAKPSDQTYIYLWISVVILTLIIIGVIVFDFNDKNVIVQPYLPDIYANLQEKSSLINPKYKVRKIHDITVVNNFLNEDVFLKMKQQFNNKKYESSNVILRKATGIDFFKLHQKSYPGILELFYSNDLTRVLSSIVKKPVQRVSLADPNACSLLIYANKGDHIDWHLDFSNYYGDRYVVLLTIVNENSTKTGLSKNSFMYNHEGATHEMKMKENSLVIFKGSEILHKATAIDDDEKRILLSMVFCDICQERQKNIVSIIYEKLKNSVLYSSS